MGKNLSGKYSNNLNFHRPVGFNSSFKEQQLCAMEKSTVAGHRSALRIAEDNWEG